VIKQTLMQNLMYGVLIWILNSFCVDEARTFGAEVFRLYDDGTLSILHERIYQELGKANLQGVILKNTRESDGCAI
jgi:hypothetical protein